MSSLLVEVCRIEKIEPHPYADRLFLSYVKGWQTAIRKLPDGKPEFNVGDLVIYFPPDSVLPQKLAHGPTDNPPGRLGIVNFLGLLDKNEDGVRPPGYKVKAARLRGIQSFGFVMAIDPSKGDLTAWKEGDDVKEFFGVTKYEPPERTDEGDEDEPNDLFRRYTDLEHFSNFPNLFKDGEEVIITEKLHGRCTRIGLVIDKDENGDPTWRFMVGSHDVPRKKDTRIMKRTNRDVLAEKLSLAEDLVVPGLLFRDQNGKFWMVEKIDVKTSISDTETTTKFKVVCFQVEHKDPEFNFKGTIVNDAKEDWNTVYTPSEYWTGVNPQLEEMLEYIKDEIHWNDEKTSIIVFGETYGSGVQDMSYGLKQGTKGFRIFDIAINHKYLDYEVKAAICSKFEQEMVPVLYRGPFSQEVVLEITSGPTSLCEEKEIYTKFKGREGVVITPVMERIVDIMMTTSTDGRVILKSVSADYLARAGGTEDH